LTLSPDIKIRPLLPSDAALAASLSAELGYPVAAEVMERRIRLFSALEKHALFGACLHDQLIAWIDVGIVYHLQAEPYGEIGGLVVSKKHHGSGIGKALVEAAEQWITSQGVTQVLVRSQIAREGVHAFYLRQGFTRTKTSAVFMKSIEPC